MKERPILFSGEMVKAILDGRKTQTRRVVRPGSPAAHCYLQPMWGASPPPDPVEFGEPGLWIFAGPDYPDAESDERRCPCGVVGDRLWVREKFSVLSFTETESYQAEYAADGTIGGEAINWTEEGKRQEQASRFCDGKNHPSIHMPRWASRLLLEVKDVRVERLQEITADGARAEGWPGQGELEMIPKEWFALLWDSLNAKRGFSWASDPWVWCISFKRIE